MKKLRGAFPPWEGLRYGIFIKGIVDVDLGLGGFRSSKESLDDVELDKLDEVESCRETF